MTIPEKTFALTYKIVIFLAAAAGFWFSLLAFGDSALRVLSTWVLILAVIYYFVDIISVARRKVSNRLKVVDSMQADMAELFEDSRPKIRRPFPSPMLRGAIIMSLLLSSVLAGTCHFAELPYPTLGGFAAGLVYGVLALLVISDWLLVEEKGRFRMIDPVYFLALPVTYVATMIFTAIVTPKISDFLYPIPFLDYENQGFYNMCIWMSIIMASIIVLGYLLVLFDAAMGGKLTESKDNQKSPTPKAISAKASSNSKK